MKSLLFVILLLFANLNLQAQQYYQVATETLNVRKLPSGKSAVVSQFTLNDSVQVIGRVGAWSKVALEDGSFGYVSSRFLSEEFKNDESIASTTSTKVKANSWEIYMLIGFAVLVFLIRVFFSGSSSSNSGKSKAAPKRSTTPPPKLAANEDITQVKEDAHWYTVYNSDGKRLSTKGKAKHISLASYSSKLILLEEGPWYMLYDFKFNHIATKAIVKGDQVLNVSPNTITIKEGVWIRTYDAKFKPINTRPA